MCKLNFTFNLKKLAKSESFCEASAQELRVLLALISSEGEASEDELSALAGVSTARLNSALTLWEGEGVISRRSTDGNITEEFEARLVKGEILEESAAAVAGSIRSENLASTLEECATLMGKAALNSTEMKCITALTTQYGLSPEYILTLAADMVAKGKRLTAARLRDEAIRLCEKRGIETLEQLEKALEEGEGNETEWVFKRLLGIYRPLSDDERAFFKRWAEEMGFGREIVREAFNLAVRATGHGSVYYMDKVLSGWHEKGCRTVKECLEAAKDTSAELAKAHGGEAAPKKKRSEPEKPRYGSFDINDAFAKALARSYGEEAGDN